MAEQEACTELVEKASQDQVSTTFEGESQLLPLLQGLLEAPDNEQTADSGTESGEDQRSSLIAEVQNALDKLSTNLRDDATDITPERRSSLLQLVTKLQAGLAASVPNRERRASGQGRFRRRQRPNRHTVGVSSEELADARRLIEEISLHDLTPQSSSSKISVLQKQNSEGSVGQNATAFKPFLTQKSVVKNAVAKPFSSSNSTISGNSSSVQTPTESLDFLFNEDISEKKPEFSSRSTSMDEQSIRRSSSGEVASKTAPNALKQAINKKSTENLLENEETDEDTTMKVVKEEERQQYNPAKPEIVMQTNPLYQKFSSDDRSNKFTSKKLKMKRANTIDIPKPLNFYEDDADSDCSLPDEDYQQRRRSNYLALRGPIRIGNTGNNKSTLPVFEPKTDNDKKFLAFINKHNETTAIKKDVKNSIWSKPETHPGNIWSNKFGNIKTAFEKASVPNPSHNSARQFWKSADDAVTSTPKYDGPKISKQSARNLRQMFEEKQRESQKLPWSTTQNDKNIVTGSLKVKAFEPHNDKTYKFIPQPLPVNKFSHAPQSAFKPIQKKNPPPNLHISKTPIRADEKEKDLDSPLFLYSPKPPNEPQSLKPWAANPGESRVLSLAASKFENASTPEPIPVKPRRLSKDKVTLQFHQQVPEKLSAPYLVKSAEQKNSTVKQLSGQYDHGGRNSDYATYSTVKYTMPQNDHQNQGQYYDSKQYRQDFSKIPPQKQNSDHQYSGKSYQDFNNKNYHQTATPNQQTYPVQAQKYLSRQQSKESSYQKPQQYQQEQYSYPQHYNEDRRPQYGAQTYNQIYSAKSQDVQAKNSAQDVYYHSDEAPHYTSQGHSAILTKNSAPNEYYHSDRTPNYNAQTYSNTPNQVYLAKTQEVSSKRSVNDEYFDPDRVPHYNNTTSSQVRSAQKQEVPSPAKNSAQNDYYHSDRAPNYNAQTYSKTPSQAYAAKTKEVASKQSAHDEYYHSDRILHYNNSTSNQDRSAPNQEVSIPTKKSVDDEYYRPQQQYQDPQYTSTYQYQTKPREAQHFQNDKPEPKPENPPKYNSQLSVENLKEYNAVSSRVMTGPVSQQATTIRQKSPMSRDEHDMAAALNLRNALQKISPKPESAKIPSPVLSPSNTKESNTPVSPINYNSHSDDSSPSGYITNNVAYSITYPKDHDPPKIISPPNYNDKRASPNSFSYRPREEPPKPISPHSFTYKNRESVSSYKNDKRAAPFESLEITDNGESIVTSKFQIPVINVPEPESPRLPTLAQINNKADSWKQICLQTQQPLHKPSPRASPNARTVSKSKSSHSLALPKQFEAGMSKDEIALKRKTMEAFLSGSKSPQTLSRTTSNETLNKTETKTKRSINRLKTTEKISTYHQSTGLSRSRTLPDIVCPQMLDETNVDKAFEELFKSST